MPHKPPGLIKVTNRKKETESHIPDFPSGTVDRNLPANTGDTGSIPGPGRFHMPWSN